MMSNILIGALYSATSSMFIAGSQAFKNTSGEKKEEIDLMKFIKTIAIAAVVGALTSFGFDPSMTTGAITGLVSYLGENAYKGIKRRFKNA